MTPRIPVDPDVSRTWTAIAHSSRYMNRLLSLVSHPAERSNFSQVNRLYASEHASDWHRSYLDAALQHMLLWADIVAPLRFHPEQEVVQTLRPAYTLGRAALEASSQAVWMTGATTPLECTRRHLSLIRWDFDEHRKSLQDDEAKQRVRERDATLLERARGLFEEHELGRPSLLNVLRDAASVIEVDQDDIERLWRAASGAAHGKVWPSMSLQNVVPLNEYEPGHFRAVRIPDAEAMTEILKVADQMITYGVLRHADFCGTNTARLMNDASAWLLSVIPVKDGADQLLLERLAQSPGAVGSGER